jgi:glucokinase
MKLSAIGIDIGGTNVKLGLVDETGRVLLRSAFLTGSAAHRKHFLEILSLHVRELILVAHKEKLKLAGVGVGAPGPIDVEKGFVYFFPNIPGWRNTPLKSILEKRLKQPVFVDNDANVMALAEFRFGAGRGCNHMIALTLGTGVGGGMVIDGKLFHGPHYSAAEIGHLVIQENGPLCACGNHGCIEAYVGNGYFVRETHRLLKAQPKSLLKRWVEKEHRVLTSELVAEAARRGDVLSKNMWKKSGEHLGTALTGLVNILNPERIIIGGGLAQAGSLLFKPLKATLKKKAFPIAARSVRVLPAVLGVDAGLIGAAALALAQTEN